jgi:acetyltransferase-like isoleucine patch superfamily enzyme
MTKSIKISWFDRQLSRFNRKLELWRGQMVRWRGAQAGIRFGLGRHVRIEYARGLCAGDDVSIEDNSFLRCLSERGVIIGSHTSLGRNLWLSCGRISEAHSLGWFEIGEYSYIGPNGVMGAGGGIKIGNHVQMGPNVTITAENHRFDNPDRLMDEQGVSHQGVVVEDNVWIGGRVTILDGVTIGRGSVIGAGAVVTQSIPPYSIAVGMPARVLRSRKSTAEEE